MYRFLILRSNVLLKYMLLVCLRIRSGIPPFTCARSALEKLRIKQENDISEVNISWKMGLICYAASYMYMQSLEFLKKCWNLPSNFPDLEKVWKMEIKYGKIVKSLEFFFLSSKLQQVLSRKWNIICFGEILFNIACAFIAHHAKSFVPAFFMSLLIT